MTTRTGDLDDQLLKAANAINAHGPALLKRELGAAGVEAAKAAAEAWTDADAEAADAWFDSREGVSSLPTAQTPFGCSWAELFARTVFYDERKDREQ